MENLKIYCFAVIFNHQTGQIVDNRTFTIKETPYAKYNGDTSELIEYLVSKCLIPIECENPTEFGYEIIITEVYSYSLRKRISQFYDELEKYDLAEIKDPGPVTELFNILKEIMGHNYPEIIRMNTMAVCMGLHPNI